MSDGEFKEYVVEYGYRGARWGATIKAASIEDAEARIKAMGTFGRVDGELMATIPAGGGWLVKAFVWLANSVGRRP